jgi:hypothetical protein
MSTSTLQRSAMGALVGAVLFLTSGCSETVRTGRSPAYLVIDEIAVEPAGESEETNVLASDVVTNGTVFEDLAIVSLRLALRDIGQPGNPNTPTANNAITINRYRVSYRRTDGRNTPGADVPHAFEGAATITVRDTADLSFELVRLQAKLEPPLRQLADTQGGPGGSVVISTIADVTFYGRDQAGNDVSVTGSISVNFADWADPQASE